MSGCTFHQRPRPFGSICFLEVRMSSAIPAPCLDGLGYTANQLRFKLQGLRFKHSGQEGFSGLGFMASGVYVLEYLLRMGCSALRRSKRFQMYLPVLLVVLRFLAFKTIELCIQSHPLLIHISYMCRIIEVERFLPSGLSAFSLTSGGQSTEPGIGKFRGSNF